MIDAPKMTTILWIEGNKNATPSFVPGLRKKGYLVTSVPTGKEALSFVSTLLPDARDRYLQGTGTPRV